MIQKQSARKQSDTSEEETNLISVAQHPGGKKEIWEDVGNFHK